MACSPDFVQYIIDQCSSAGEIAVKKMMGDYCAYCDGILFGLICDNNFYVKVTEPGKTAIKQFTLEGIDLVALLKIPSHRQKHQKRL